MSVEISTIRQGLLAVPGENHKSAAPVLNALKNEGFNVDLEDGMTFEAFRGLDVEKFSERHHLNLRQRSALKAVVTKANAAWESRNPRLFNNITVFIPGSSGSGYAPRHFPKLSEKQFEMKMGRERYFRVVPVKEQPSQLLALDDCPYQAVDIDDVELQDDMQLAVVVGAPDVLRQAQEQLKTLQGLSEGEIAAGEYKAAEFVTALLADKKGVRWCYKIIEAKVGGVWIKIEIDGLSFCDDKVVLVERKPRITLAHVKELQNKVQNFRLLVEAGAPHTGMLRLANGQVKPLEVFLMADGWTANQDEAAACAVHMEEHNIRPLLPTGDGGYAVRDSCNRWPVNDNIRQRAQQYLTKLDKKGRSGGAATDAGVGSGAAGPNSAVGSGAAGPNGAVGSGGSRAVGPNGAVGSGRNASSQQAACSPAPTGHLRSHDPFSAARAGVQRRVASVRHPPHLHPPLLHRSSMPSVRLL